jgi:biotin operon repressor
MAKRSVGNDGRALIGGAVRARLAALRDDCRRHPESPVRLIWLEGPLGKRTGFELALERFNIETIARLGRTSADHSRSTRCYLEGKRDAAAPRRVLAWLEQLGQLAEQEPALGGDPSQRGWARAAEIVCGRAWARKVRVSLEPPTVQRDERGRVHLIVTAEPSAEEVEIDIPDTAAAIASSVDELLLETAVDAPEEHDAAAFTEPSGNDAQTLRELWAHDRGEFIRGDGPKGLALLVGIEPRALRKLIQRLREGGWGIETKQGRTGGYRLAFDRLSPAQRAWLERGVEAGRARRDGP